MPHIITYHQDLQETGKKFRETKTKISDIVASMNQRLDKETEKERKELDVAFQRYQDKIASVMKKREFIEYESKLDTMTKEMKLFAQQAYKFYEIELQNIEKQNTSLEQKQKAKKELMKYLMDQFMTDEEKKFFERLVHESQAFVFIK